MYVYVFAPQNSDDAYTEIFSTSTKLDFSNKIVANFWFHSLGAYEQVEFQLSTVTSYVSHYGH